MSLLAFRVCEVAGTALRGVSGFFDPRQRRFNDKKIIIEYCPINVFVLSRILFSSKGLIRRALFGFLH
jgi:hypothetical protein